MPSYIFIAARTLEPFDCETLPSDTIGANGTVSSASGSDAGVRTLGACTSVGDSSMQYVYQCLRLRNSRWWNGGCATVLLLMRQAPVRLLPHPFPC